jgi:hypothetical protein
MDEGHLYLLGPVGGGSALREEAGYARHDDEICASSCFDDQRGGRVWDETKPNSQRGAKDEFSVCNPPDRSVSVFRHEECAVLRDCHSNGPSPHIGVVDDKPGEKILVPPNRRSVFERNSDDFISRAFGSIPRSMFGRESITPIFRRKHFSVVKSHPERGRMGLD